ncbi:MAG: hypothetical protein WD270_05160 [Acetobacterales bacterium]
MAAWHDCVFPCVCTLLTCTFAEPDTGALDAARQGQQPDQPGMTERTPGAEAGRALGGRASQPQEVVEPPNPYRIFGENQRVPFADRMRELIIAISAYTEQRRPGFAIIVENGLDLVTADGTLKTDPVDSFIAAIDGVIVDGLYAPGTTIADRGEKMELVRRGRGDHWAVLAMERLPPGADPAPVVRQLQELDMIPLIAPFEVSPEAPLPDLRNRPINESADNITRLTGVRNYLNLTDASGFMSQGAMVELLTRTNYDMLVLPLHHPQGRYISQDDVRDLRLKRLGSRRALVGRLSVAEAEAGSYYWRPEWSVRRPRWVQEAGRRDGTFFTRFWQREWQQILFGDSRSVIDGVLAVGLDGIVLDVANVHRIYDLEQDASEDAAGVKRRTISSDRTLEMIQQLRGTR